MVPFGSEFNFDRILGGIFSGLNVNESSAELFGSCTLDTMYQVESKLDCDFELWFCPVADHTHAFWLSLSYKILEFLSLLMFKIKS